MKTTHLHLRSFAVVVTTLLLLVALPATAVFAAAYGPNYPTLAAAGSWANPARIQIVDGGATGVSASTLLPSTITNISSYLRAYNFDFSPIPDGATIEGVSVEIGRYGSGTESTRVKDNEVRLVNASGVIVGDNKAKIDEWPATQMSTIYGGATDTWGASLTAADIKDQDFGVVLSIINSSTSTRVGNVDYIKITITYNGGTNITATTGTGGIIGWGNPNDPAANISSDNSTYWTGSLTASATSNYMRAYGFGFGIPSDATVDGITVEIDRYSSGTSPRIQDHTVRLVNASGSIVGDNKSSGAEWAGVDTIASFGGSSDNWAAGLTPADINDPNFGVVLAVTNPSTASKTANVDYIRVTVTYSEPGTPTTTTLSSLSSVTYGTQVTFTATVDPIPTVGMDVEFYDGLTLLGTGATNASGVATYTTSATQLNVAGSPHSITAKFVGDSSFASSTSAAQNQAVEARSLTVTATATDKVYDATTAASVTLSTNALAGDTVDTAFTSATFVNKNVGADKTVTVSGISISGTDAGNYSLVSNSANTTASITPKGLTVTATASDKVYDATTIASVTLTTDALAGDTVTTTYTSATFANKTVGTDKTVTVSGISIGSTDAGNYNLLNTSDADIANITPKSLTVTATAANKVYDANTTASVTLSTNALAGDTVDTAFTSATFVNKNVGTGKTVTVSGISISGTDAGNYSLVSNSANTTANITAKDLTVTATASDKVYDATTTASVTLTTDALAGDTVTTTYTSATFADKNIGTDKTVTVSGITIGGTDAGNYNLLNTSDVDIADITPKSLTVTATATNKVYDATTAASVTLSTNAVVGDTVNTAFTSATFDNQNVGTGKTVTVSGISISGTDAGNYSLASNSANTTANITAKPITVTPDAGQSKIYGTVDPAFTYTHTDLIGSDAITGSLARAAGDDVDNYAFNLGSLTAGANYSLSITPTNFAITAKPITVTPDTGQSKVYGTADPVFTYTHTPLVGTDALTGALGRDTGNDVGTYNFTIGTLSASANYTISVAAETFEITKATPTLSVTNSPVIYDGAAHAANVTGSVPGVVSNILTGGAAAQTDKGVYPVTADFVPTDTLNYNSLADAAAGNFVITGKIITVSPDAGQNKVYGDDDPVFTYTNDELEPGDVFTGALGREAGEDIGTYDFTIGTLSAGDNYAIVLADETFEITVKPITVTPNPGQRKAPGDPDPVFTYTSDPLVAGDTFTGALGRIAGEDIGIYAFTLGTLSAGSNYDLSLALETFEITDKTDPTLSVTNSPVTYTGLGQAAVVTGSVPGTVSNILTGGAATQTDSGTYPVTADFVPTDTSSYNSLIGASAGDLVINQAALTVTANNQTIVAGSPDPIFTVTYSGFVNGETAAVLTTAPTCSVAAPHTTPGAYDITCSGGVATNYAFTYVKGTLTVTPSNSAPTNIALSKTTVDQKQAVGTLVGSFSTTDPNPADTFTYSLVAGTGSADNASFTISGNELRTAAVFDFAVKNSYSIRVRSTDNGGLFFEKAFTITVNSQAPVFTDVPFDYWANNYIERLYKAGVTGGCGAGIYCPDDSVTRAQMAVFLLKGIKGSDYVPPAVGDSTGFTDVATGYWAAPWIKQLAAEGITAGCGDGTTYCPEQAVTRAQMAVFLLKSKYGKDYAPPALNGDTTFTDVALDYWAARWIKQLAAEGITGGCGAGTYCPEQAVTRAQMAVFLVKTFNLP